MSNNQIATVTTMDPRTTAGEMYRLPSGREQSALACYLGEKKTQLAKAARGGVNSEQIAWSVIRAVQDDSKLQKCSCHSVYQSMLIALELGLLIGPAAGESYLVPFSNNVADKGQPARWEMACTFMLGYKGSAKLAYQSGFIRKMEFDTVYRGDLFKIRKHETPQFIHEPDIEANHDDSNIIAVYCQIWTTTGPDPIFAWMNRQDVEKIRQSAPSANSPAWKNWWGEMAKGKLLKRACKPLPKSPDLVKAFAYDTAVEMRNYKDVVAFDHEDLQDIPMLAAPEERSGSANVERAATDAAVRKAKEAKASPSDETDPALLVPVSTASLNEYTAMCKTKGVSEMKTCMDVAGCEPINLRVGQFNMLMAYMEALP